LQVNEQQNYNRYIRKKGEVVKPEAKYCASFAIWPKSNIDSEM